MSAEQQKQCVTLLLGVASDTRTAQVTIRRAIAAFLMTIPLADVEEALSHMPLDFTPFATEETRPGAAAFADSAWNVWRWTPP